MEKEKIKYEIQVKKMELERLEYRKTVMNLLCQIEEAHKELEKMINSLKQII